LFLSSGNDAALALAQHVAGNEEQFVAYMNETAAALGMHNTHFSNPHGLDDVGLYSTAADMAQAGRLLLNDPVLSEISVAPTYRPDWPGAELKNGNRLLQSYPGAFGVKIGFTGRAHQTIVAAADHDGRQLVVSLLYSEDRYADATSLLDWAFANSRAGCVPRGT
jgi:D-alanyl-D-alanine carboxypeptidase (penicillin-binding protein 5/6)